MTTKHTYQSFAIGQAAINEIQSFIAQKGEPTMFLRSVLENNIKNAVAYGTDDEIKNIPAYLDYIYQNADKKSYGSVQKVNNWLKYPADELPICLREVRFSTFKKHADWQQLSENLGLCYKNKNTGQPVLAEAANFYRGIDDQSYCYIAINDKGQEFGFKNGHLIYES